MACIRSFNVSPAQTFETILSQQQLLPDERINAETNIAIKLCSNDKVSYAANNPSSLVERKASIIGLFSEWWFSQ